MRDEKSDLPPPPRKADEHGGQHIHSQCNVDCSEPAGAVHDGSGRRAGVLVVDPCRRGQHRGIDCDQHHGQLQRRQGAKTELESGKRSRERVERWAAGRKFTGQWGCVFVVAHPVTASRKRSQAGNRGGRRRFSATVSAAREDVSPKTSSVPLPPSERLPPVARRVDAAAKRACFRILPPQGDKV